jgi:hypothetical protein
MVGQSLVQPLGKLALVARRAGTNLLKSVASLSRSLQHLQSRGMRWLGWQINIPRGAEGLAGVGKTSEPLRRPKVVPNVLLNPLIQRTLKTRAADAPFAAGNLA